MNRFVLFSIGLCFVLFASAQEKALFRDAHLPRQVRIKDLISKLTVEEKVHQLMNSTPAIERLGIPAYDWWNEALHGVGRSGVATVFPQAIGLGATFDEALALRVATAISDEARAMFNMMQARGNNNQYAGLSFWTPNINIFRDPRWGRGQETYGEDPFLTASLGVAFVNGLQGKDPNYLKTSACAKHFAVHSGPEGLRHSFNAKASPKDLYETYLPAFKALVGANVESVMCAYNRTNDEPCCGSNVLLGKILRKDWGFKGHVVSDCGAILDIFEGHKVVDSKKAAAAYALTHGVDLNCGYAYFDLVDAVKEGLVTVAQLDSAVTHMLNSRFKLGLFDEKGINPYDKLGKELINSPEHRALAREVAQKSMVLLKNNGVLPLKNDLKRYFVTGPNASNIEVLLGNYYGVNGDLVTVLEGVGRAIDPSSQLQFAAGCLLDKSNVNPVDWASGNAKLADATIAVLGVSGMLEGEEGESLLSSHYGDKLDYNLPANQIEYLKKLRNGHANPIIAVITGGSPMNLAEVEALADAVLLVWYPGEEGGNAVADLIFGKVSPSGKLPITFPRSYEDLPAFDNYSMDGRTYRYMTNPVLYPFGFGLSYTTFTYTNAAISAPKVKKGQSVTASVMLTNTGKVESDEVAQLYVSVLDAKMKVPISSLKGVKRVHLLPGETKKVEFVVTPEMMEVVDLSGLSSQKSGRIKLSIGSASPGGRSEELGAAKMAELMFVVK